MSFIHFMVIWRSSCCGVGRYLQSVTLFSAEILKFDVRSGPALALDFEWPANPRRPSGGCWPRIVVVYTRAADSTDTCATSPTHCRPHNTRSLKTYPYHSFAHCDWNREYPWCIGQAYNAIVRIERYSITYIFGPATIYIPAYRLGSTIQLHTRCLRQSGKVLATAMESQDISIPGPSLGGRVSQCRFIRLPYTHLPYHNSHGHHARCSC